jgi:hypothetical protein
MALSQYIRLELCSRLPMEAMSVSVILSPGESMPKSKVSAAKKSKTTVKKIRREIGNKKSAPVSEELIRSLRASCKSADHSMVEARDREHRLEELSDRTNAGGTLDLRPGN